MEFDRTLAGYFDAEENNTGDQDPSQKKSKKGTADGAPENSCFDCNICFDSAVDPAVTLCGHLYCRTCIHKWLQLETIPSSNHCPVCKAPVSENSLIPIYGQAGITTKGSTQSHAMVERQFPTPSHQLNRHPYGFNYAYARPTSSQATSSILHSTAGLVMGTMADAILRWVYRNQQELVGGACFSNPYRIRLNENNPRMRRQELRVENSLHQFWVFLFCCAILCFLLF